ncbi:MAG TPA: dihydropteroate synthase [Chryseosolibacter sp.]|nr:dihydropteroate synthase [Chryseosolibacter sp.]
MQNTPFSTNKTLNINGRLLDLTIPKVMGVLNVTPDSFYDGGHYNSDDVILRQTEKMISEGADIIDVGGYSSRPDADDIPVQEEQGRIEKAISLIARNFPDVIISIDTFRSAVAEAAVQAGAAIVNDISAGDLDPRMFETVARLQVPYIAMHMRGTPKTMKTETQYSNLVKEVIQHLQQRLVRLRELDVHDVIIDPGFGFAKNITQNFGLLHNLEKLSILGKPMLVGLSRKSLIWKTLQTDPAGALNGTTALNMVALIKGADILRVHDVKEAKEVIKLFTSLQVNIR